MTEEPQDPPDPTLDERMARLLQADRSELSKARRELRDSQTEESADLLGRIAALDYVDSLVGQLGSDLPERLGEYRITDLLGRGGMGTVFEAFQESLERKVALKVLSPALTNDQRMRRRFRSEARASATLHHQHIVPVYGFGESAGYLYFTMERVNGVSLDKHIATARSSGEFPDCRESARAFSGVADALAHAHRRGILHRDVKPGNILVHPDGSFALADFGLSKMLGDVSMSLSHAGGFLGTLHYAAPEQAKGRDAGPATDLYALGVTMFEHLTGRLPLEGKTTEAMLEAILNATPRRLRSLRPRAPKDLCAVVDKLLRKDPEDRYADGEELARDLMRVADDEPVRIRRLPTLVRVWRQVRKHPGISAALTAVAALLVVVLWQWRVNADARANQVLAQHAELVASALDEITDEPGDPAGPAKLLASLTGMPIPHRPPSGAVVADLDRALALLDDDKPTRIKRAYERDPMPEVTVALRDGRGAGVIAPLTRRIDSLSTRDDEDVVELYRLLLARAVASLTASVADPAAARDDLFHATFLRDGAVFPELLLAFVDWRPENGADALLRSLDEARGEAGELADRPIGALLVAVAGISMQPGGNLMQVDMTFDVRRALHERGVELWGGVDVFRRAIAGPANLGLGARLAEHALEASRYRASPARLREETGRGRDLLPAEVAPGSPLNSWSVVYDLLESKPVSLVADARMAARLVRGISDYLQLPDVRDDRQVRSLAPGIDDWLAELPDRSVAAARLRALLGELGGASDRALAAANAWVATDTANPAAYLCRMRCALHLGKDEILQQGVCAWQLAVDQDRVRDEIVATLRAAEENEPRLRDLWREFAEEGS